MTIEEAINFCTEYLKGEVCDTDREFLETAKQALEKQIPKKPNKVHRHKGGFVKRTIIDAIGEKHEGYSDERYADDILQCPVCKAFQYGNFCNYCDNCGQKFGGKNDK